MTITKDDNDENGSPAAYETGADVEEVIVGESEADVEEAAAVDESDDDSVTEAWKGSPFVVGLMRREAMANKLCCQWSQRVGNMVVLLSGTETIEDSNGETTTRPRLIMTVGPYWPFLLGVTYPLIIAVSAATAYLRIYKMHFGIIIAWSILTLALLVAVTCVGCRNPGILYRHAEPLEEDWTWNDQAITWRPPKAKFDSECACVVEEFDHTCPWTGTAIGKRNMCAFKCFCILVFGMLFFDAILLANPILW